MSASANFPGLPSDWIEEQHYINNNKIFIRVYKKKNAVINRWLFIVHGQGEQSDRYEHFPFYLNSCIEAVAAVDLIGHGKSLGQRGHINHFDQYSLATVEAFQHCTKLFPKSEAHWLGHSLGGLITLRTLFKKQDLPIQSVCVSAPLLGLAMPVPPLKKFFGILIEPLIGKLPLKNEINPEYLSKNISVQKGYLENPLNHSYVTPRFFVQMNSEMERLKAPLGDFCYNLMILCPLADEIVNWKTAYLFYDRVKMKSGLKKELQSFPNFKHESFNEEDKERAFIALENWILKNTKPRGEV